jgi:hypothetical protein
MPRPCHPSTAVEIVLNASNAQGIRRLTVRRVYGALAVKDVHIVVGCLALGLNMLAFVLGAIAWSRARPSAWFWRLLRGGQATVAVEAGLGGVLLLMGRRASDLHLLYGVLPLVVALLAEQLKLSAATMVLDARGLEDAQAVGRLSRSDQREVVIAIMRREIGVMTLSALVVTGLLARAATVVH